MDFNKTIISLCLLLMPSFVLYAQEDEEEIFTDEDNYEHVTYSRKKGFMFGVNIGMLLANNGPADFYDGREPNTIYPYIENTNSNSYQVLVDYFGTPEFSLAELPAEPTEMNYKLAVSFGFNARYQLDWTNAFVADFNFSNLEATGFAVFEVVDFSEIQGFYRENIPLYGKESRFTASVGYQANLTEPSSMGFIFEIGPMMTSAKVNRNAFIVGNREFNILRPQLTAGNQYINNTWPTVNSLGAYSALGFNIEFDKFTVDAMFRVQYEKVQFDEFTQEGKRKLNYLPGIRMAYRIIK